jgi:cysteine desulfuration protein SufE
LLLRVYSNRKPREIAETAASFVAALQLEQHLSPTRSNGLSAMLKAIYGFAKEALVEA